jgi:hypothetical protein
MHNPQWSLVFKFLSFWELIRGVFFPYTGGVVSTNSFWFLSFCLFLCFLGDYKGEYPFIAGDVFSLGCIYLFNLLNFTL